MVESRVSGRYKRKSSTTERKGELIGPVFNSKIVVIFTITFLKGRDIQMKKTAILAITAATMLTASIGFTAPLTDYSAGKTAIDLTFRNSDVDATASGNHSLSKTFDGKSSIDWGITTGLGNNFAIQYNGYNAKSKDKVLYSDASENDSLNFKLKVQEFNLLYKLDENISAYTGIVRTKGDMNENDTINGVTTSNGSSTNTNSKLQFGLAGSTKIADKTTAYAQVGVASDFTNWKVGVSQEIAPNLDLNVDYRRIEAKNLTSSGTKVDLTAKGLGFGVTYKF